MEIIPAIALKNYEDLEDKLSQVAKLVPLVQIDVNDGSLTQIHSWPYQSSTKHDAFFDAIIREEQGFPFWEELEFEAHFMVRQPERIISDWIAAGASRVIVQVEGTEHFEKSIEAVASRVPLGAALALDTPNEVLEPIAKDISVIQCMGWELSHLGRQGVPLDEGVFDKIKALRQKYPEHIIEVDGGVTLENAPRLLEAGASRLAVTSALWRDGALRENLAKFKELVR
ncbi:MAG: hypothetical protein Q7S86_02195 [bacterium]|nr:hypothetical protein [bacterium]